jgi:hypothetical protein
MTLVAMATAMALFFLSLSQITRYKSNRKESNTDDYDIKLIQSFMKNVV